MAILMTVVRELAPKMEKRAEEFNQERESYQAFIEELRQQLSVLQNP
jgi:hypothetical protein